MTDMSRPIDIEGCLFGIHDELPTGEIKPILFTLNGKNVLPIFSTEEKLYEAYTIAGIGEFLKIKQIDSPVVEFLDSIPYPVIYDPWITDKGNTRFHLVKAE